MHFMCREVSIVLSMATGSAERDPLAKNVDVMPAIRRVAIFYHFGSGLAYHLKVQRSRR
ncbi:predicted protein [Pyrenophora tritici-repentis Pt-1C-BFP]|uniref:Uncharacterized protein n=1 Tax=Pyrenophora tritici-repentis (strain Pt-1C-BFP) TaxID=426418 RepID=B2WBL1_PYRTR|nr:uncharacterized protein PTRG_07024 [Pyrenophora tritici-repentis Pt-1C-BFP]EDU49943.1 predicted protein [Pyrenophora tritici-repentis Pt-1C-BFP]